MNHPRILHLRPSNFVGGPEQQLLRHAELERDGAWEILLGTFVGQEEGADFLQAIEVRRLRAVSLPAGSLRTSFHALVQVLQEERIALLCTHGYKADILGLLAARRADIPVACFLRGWTGENRKVELYEAVDRFALHFADRVICLSEAQAKRLFTRSALKKKIRVVCNAIDAPTIDPGSRLHARSELRERFALPQNCVVVATAGRLSPEKGIADFLQAVSKIENQFPDVRFLIFGDGFLRQQLEHNAHRLGLQSRVLFTGFHHDLRTLLPGLDLLVNPSLSEEMPNIVLEGMAAGIPVIATAVGGVEGIAGTENAIRLVPPARPEILANAIGELLREPLCANELALAGRRRVERGYSLEMQRSRFHTLYQELLPSHQPDPLSRENRMPVEGAAQPSQRPTRLKGKAPFLTVVIPVRNEELHVGTVLAELESQEYPRDRFEVLVAEGNSTDGTAKVVAAFKAHASISVQLLGNPAQLSSAGRNVGARNARGEFVIYLDGHCHIPSKTLLRDAVELFENTGADCLCRPQPLTMSDNTVFQDVVAHARATPLGHGQDSTIYATNWEGPVNPSSAGALYRRSVFDRIGCYDEGFDACEDVEFNYRVFKAGLRSYLSPRLAVLYRPRGDLKSLWKQMLRYGRGRCRLVRKHPDAFSVSQIIPLAFLVWLGVGTVSSFFSGRIAEFFLVILAAYLLVVLAFSAGLALRYGWRHFVLAPVVYAAIHFGLGAGFLVELLAAGRGQDRSWKNHIDAPPLGFVGSMSEPASTDQVESRTRARFESEVPKARSPDAEYERLTPEKLP